MSKPVVLSIFFFVIALPVVCLVAMIFDGSDPVKTVSLGIASILFGCAIAVHR